MASQWEVLIASEEKCQACMALLCSIYSCISLWGKVMRVAPFWEEKLRVQYRLLRWARFFWLKEIFAGSNSGARGNCGKHLFRGKYIAINATQILFLAESKLCSKSDSFQNVSNLFPSLTTWKLVPNFKLWMYRNSICWGLDNGGLKDLISMKDQ